jgi:hypothetical protein
MGLFKWVGDVVEDIGDAITQPFRQHEGFTDYIAGRRAFVNAQPLPGKAKLLVATNIVLREKTYKAVPKGDNPATNALTRTLFDTTTYPDRAIVTLTNNRGFDVFLTSLTLNGNRIMQYSGEAGELIHDSLKRDDDIRRNGEKVFEVGNEFIVDATQCASIADYWYKFLGKKKHMYAVSIPGCAYWYEVGDWYNFQVGEADTNEFINTTVEVYAVDVEKTAGGIGTTSLLLREVEESWGKSTLYATRLATGGSPKRRVNRSNIVTVASVDYDGTYDYKCDGTDDDEQIQAAIDYVSATFGGGTILLTHGEYNIADTIILATNITLQGEGLATEIHFATDVNTVIEMGQLSNNVLKNIYINGENTARTIGLIGISAGSGDVTNAYVENVAIKNIVSSGIIAGISMYSGSQGIVTKCTVMNLESTGANVYGIDGANRCEYNYIDTIISTGSGYGISASTKCQQNTAINCTTAGYDLSYADAGSSNLCADTAAGGYNS